MWGARFRRLGPGIVGGAVGLLAWGSALDEARACVPEFGRVVSVTPSSDRHPANAAVVIGGYGLGTYGLTATIDEGPADLRIDQSLSMLSPLDAGYDTLALRLSPEPNPGQRVAISGDPSAIAWDATGTFFVEYVAEEGDLTLPPPSPLAWWWDLTTYEPLEDPFDTDSCGFPPAAGSIAITARIADAPTVERPAFVRFRVSPETSTLGRSYQHVEFATSQEFTTWFLVYADQVRDPVEASQFCVELELLDAAGNGSGPEELCVPCRMKVRGQPPFERWCRPAEHECPSEDPPATPGGICGETEHDAGTGGEPEDPPDSGEHRAEPAPNEGPGDAGAGASPPPGGADGSSRDASAESAPRDAPTAADATADAGDAGSSRMEEAGKADGPDEPRRRPLADDDGDGCSVSSGKSERAPWAGALVALLLVARRRRA